VMKWGGGRRPRDEAVSSSFRRLGLDRLVCRVPRAGGLAGGKASGKAGGRPVEPQCHELSG